MSKNRTRINQYIRVPQVRVIDENGVQLGVLRTDEALRLAQERGFDLVEIAPQADPPVCKLDNFGAFKYRQEKAERKSKAKQRKIDVKGIRISLKIGQHDFEHRINQAIKFLEAGDKVRIEMILRGREMQHVDRAKQKINEFLQAVGNAKVEQPLTRQGKRFTMLIGK